MPVAILIARGDRAGDGKGIADQLVASFNYWHLASGELLDIIYAGWTQSGDKLSYDIYDFHAFVQTLQSGSTWKFGGEVEILILSFVINTERRSGYFDFDEVLIIPIEKMIKQKLIDSVDGFVQQILNYAQLVAEAEDKSVGSAVSQISDMFGWMTGKEAAGNALLSFLPADVKDAYKKANPLAVRKLTRKTGTPTVFGRSAAQP